MLVIEQAERLYNLVTSSMQAAGMPLVPFDQLTLGGSTKPDPWPLQDDLEKPISRALFEKLIQSVPSESATIQDMLKSYQKQSNGYEALFAIMSQSCGFLQPIRPCWGPVWEETMNGHVYLAKLQTFLDNQRRYR